MTVSDELAPKNSVRAVLGIDAAWTLGQPSGVALAKNVGSGWQLVAVAPSYEQFNALAQKKQASPGPLTGSRPSAVELLSSCEALAGCRADLVAIDMPLSREPITARRESDNMVSREYGGRKCGTHTPSEKRPGSISDILRDEFQLAGYALQTESIVYQGLIEVYPHPALVEIFSASERLPYKLAKLRSYWPNSSVGERRAKVIGKWKEIVTRLDNEIAGVSSALGNPPANTKVVYLKAYEDMIDAVVCAWVAICALEGKAVPFGDEKSAIWIPKGVQIDSPKFSAV
ncbi:DUF429 domain-containing protein [uncultured Rhodoblastus sp.]|uniref:DUF429 domain-containing protein n=1 Tax=uncultured Rhodoblastus sp. TaxID=543037 RepID=UPI0025FF9C1D|nr:DUF429 domain-containing protein [uncultured Rhodoblastus sp.]